jgi:hypothetical protein
VRLDTSPITAAGGPATGRRPKAFAAVGRTVRARNGAFRVRVTTTIPGRLRVLLKDAADRTLGAAPPQSSGAGSHALTVRLAARGAWVLRHSGAVRATLKIIYVPGDGSPSILLHRAVTLRR